MWLAAESLNWALIAFTGLAGLFWLMSATAKVKAAGTDTGEFRIVMTEGPGSSFQADGIDVLATARLQAKWNMRAAGAACAAAICQAAIYCLPKLP